MMKYVFLLFALFFVFSQAVPAPGYEDYGFGYYYPRPSYNQPSFYLPEPICSYKCPIKCFNMGFESGSCVSSFCTCSGFRRY